MDGTRPRDLVFTLFGEYLLERSDGVWAGSLIALLEPFGLTEGGVRTILSRMAKKGWLAAERVGKHAVYELTPRGRRLLEEGQSRIFSPSWDRRWSGSWILLAYSIPQDERRARDRLRDRLAWLGFGSIGNGVWITPHEVTQELDDLTEQLGLAEHLLSFSVAPLDDDRTADLVTRCWDLDDLDRKYRAFTARWSTVRDDLDAAAAHVRLDERCFRLRFNLIHEFRRFPLDDPFLPRVLLPSPWGGDDASALFRDLYERLVGPSDAWVDRVLAESAVPDRR